MRLIVILVVGALAIAVASLTNTTLPVEETVSTDRVAEFVATIPRARAAAEPFLAVGGTVLQWQYMMGEVGGAILVQDSILVVFDTEAFAIRSYDLNGEHRATWGGPGEGPAEFKELEGAAGPDGRIWIWDGGNRRFTVFQPDGTLETDFSARLLAEVIPGGAVRGGIESCRWFGSTWAGSEEEELGGVPLTGIVAQCLPASDTSVAISELPAGRWLVNTSGQMVPTQLNMERHRRMLSQDREMAVTSLPGFTVPSPPSDPQSPRFNLPIIHGNWADAASPLWTWLGGETVVYEPDGRPMFVLPRLPGRLIGVQRNVAITTRMVGTQPRVEVWRLDLDPSR